MAKSTATIEACTEAQRADGVEIEFMLKVDGFLHPTGFYVEHSNASKQEAGLALLERAYRLCKLDRVVGADSFVGGRRQT